MALSTRDIRRRIKSIKNTAQITKAMEMVAASKMRKAQEAALRTRKYATHALLLLSRIAERIDESERNRFPLLVKRASKRVLMIVISSNRGLCGGLNTNVMRKSIEFITERQQEGAVVDIVGIGKKATDALIKRGFNVIARFNEIGDSLTFLEVSPITKLAIDEFVNGTYDRIVMCYPHFLSTLSQPPVIKRIMPLGKELMEFLNEAMKKNAPEDIREIDRSVDYLFEPSAEEILSTLLPRLVEIEMYQAILEAHASEHSARMLAMKNAHDAAEDIIDDLTITYNQARQSAITTEISEIVGGVAALESSR